METRRLRGGKNPTEGKFLPRRARVVKLRRLEHERAAIDCEQVHLLRDRPVPSPRLPIISFKVNPRFTQLCEANRPRTNIEEIFTSVILLLLYLGSIKVNKFCTKNV